MSAGSRAPRRVVIENGRRAALRDETLALTEAGYDVTACAGPGEHDCPVLAGQPCDLLEDADVVVYDLDLDDPEDREVLLAVRARYPRLPIVVEATTRTARAHAAELAPCEVIVPYSMEHLTEAVTQALTHR